MKIFIDNGHGLMTAGKRSPDGKFREAFYTREIAKRGVVAELVDMMLSSWSQKTMIFLLQNG